MISELKNKHLESTFQNSFLNSFMRRYIIPNPNSNKIDDIIRKYLKIHWEKYKKLQVVLLLQILLPSNQIKYFRIQRSSYRYRLCLPDACFFSRMKTIKENFYSQIIEIRNTFSSPSKNMTDE